MQMNEVAEPNWDSPKAWVAQAVAVASGEIAVSDMRVPRSMNEVIVVGKAQRSGSHSDLVTTVLACSYRLGMEAQALRNHLRKAELAAREITRAERVGVRLEGRLEH